MFRFKQFSVDQTGCAMKINTDGVLLGAVANADNPQNILDIGTGTGVIALMLAQKFASARIDAVEIDRPAAQTAERNFANSPFAERLTLFPKSFEEYLNAYPDKKFELIVSNSPFHINSLNSPKSGKALAKHTDSGFFEGLIAGISKHLCEDGLCWLILPLPTAELVKSYAAGYGLYTQRNMLIRSFADDTPHREIICLGFEKMSAEIFNLTIYNGPKVYSADYIKLLQPYFLAF
jgi:tRNA1Val (adenine37-N6)-methyltransferase